MPHFSARTRRALRCAVVEPLEDRLLMARLAGVDVSGNQTISAGAWTSLKNAGYTYAWTKATEGFTFNDSTFTTNMTNAKNAGVLIGAYHYARYDNQKGIAGADQEAGHFWSVIQPYIVADGKHLVPVLDFENATSTVTPGTAGYTKTTISQWAVEFLNDIKNDAAAIGINLTPMIYTGASFAQTWLDATVAQSFPVWMANYNAQARDTGSPNFNGSLGPWQAPNGWQFWQYSDSQAITGFPTTDADVFKGNINDFNDYIVGAAPRWALNSRVTTNASVDAWATSASNTTFTLVNSGVSGKILSAGVYGNSFWRWQVQFDNGVTGWVGEDFMNSTTPSITTTPAPANNLLTNALPANFTWAGGANATSYKVYLDGTLKSTVTSASWAHTAISQGAHTWRVDSINAELTTTGTTWNFTFDSVAPTVTGVSSTAANGDYKAGAVIPVTITFGENVTVTGSPTLTLNSAFGGIAISYTSGSGTSTLTFNYIVGAGQNSSDLDYSSTSALALNGGTIKDAAGNAATLTLPSPGTAGSLGFNKAILIDTLTPAATYGGQVPGLLNTKLDFTVAYTDTGSGVDVSSLDSSDVTVTGPNGFSAMATLVSVDLSSNGSPRTATYRIIAPGGFWNAPDDGTYTVTQNASQVRDVAQNFAPAVTIGTFVANLPFAYVLNGALVVDYAAGQTAVTFGDGGSPNIAVTEGSSLPFDPASFSSIVINDASGSDSVLVDVPLAQPITFNGAGGNSDVIRITNNGSAVFGADVGASGLSDVTVQVDAGGSATFAASQHLTRLQISGSAALLPGEGLTIATKSLSVDGKFDLADGAIADGFSLGSDSVGSWNGSAYTGVTGLVATGRNGGTWDGSNGIVTSMPAAQSPSQLTTIGVASASSALGLSGNGATTLWNGMTVDANTVLIKYTYAGDANLSGTIDGDDYFAIDNGFASTATGYGNGDFDYNGRIDADDYFVIDSNYSKSAVALSMAASAPIPARENDVYIAQETVQKGVFADFDAPAADRRLIDDLL